MKLLVDMNLSPRWADLMRQAGHEAVHWSTVGAPNAKDRDIMAFARTEDFIVLTHDLDFGSILAATRAAKPSVVQIRADNVSFEAIGNAVMNALERLRDDLEAGALVTVDPNRLRLRLLPLRP